MWRLELALGGLLTAGVTTAVALIWVPEPWRWWLIAVVVVSEAVGVVVVPTWRFRTHRWEVSATAVYTQQGWWARERRIAPMSRVQTVELSQGLLERVFSLATVTVTTASAAGPLEIEGLDQAVAAPLVEELTRRAEDITGDAT